jgi:hypothetical protein
MLQMRGKTDIILENSKTVGKSQTFLEEKSSNQTDFILQMKHVLMTNDSQTSKKVFPNFFFLFKVVFCQPDFNESN